MCSLLNSLLTSCSEFVLVLLILLGITTCMSATFLSLILSSVTTLHGLLCRAVEQVAPTENFDLGYSFLAVVVHNDSYHNGSY